MLDIVQIGVIRSPWKQPDEVPLEGAPAVIEVDPAFAAALDGVERSSHLVVLSFFHLAATGLVARPRRLDPSAGPIGVFASRAPIRPTRIAVNVVRLLQVDRTRLEVDGIDLVDGTPVLDIKAYSPGWDAVFSAHHAPRVPPWRLGDDRLRRFLRREAEAFTGALSAATLRAVDAVALAVSTLEADPRSAKFMFCVTKCDATVDALMGMCGATFASGRIVIAPMSPTDSIRFSNGDRSLLVWWDPEIRSRSTT